MPVRDWTMLKLLGADVKLSHLLRLAGDAVRRGLDSLYNDWGFQRALYVASGGLLGQWDWAPDEPDVHVWDEAYRLVPTGSPTGGTITVDNGSVRTVLPYNATAADFHAALMAEPSWVYEGLQPRRDQVGAYAYQEGFAGPNPVKRAYDLVAEQHAFLYRLFPPDWWELPDNPLNLEDWDDVIIRGAN